jgi:hypothetical protein
MNCYSSLACGLATNRPQVHAQTPASLAVHRGEPLTGIVYLRPGGRPPAQVMADVQALMDADIDWTPAVIAVYRAGRLRLRRLSEED